MIPSEGTPEGGKGPGASEASGGARGGEPLANAHCPISLHLPPATYHCELEPGHAGAHRESGNGELPSPARALEVYYCIYWSYADGEHVRDYD